MVFGYQSNCNLLLTQPAKQAELCFNTIINSLIESSAEKMDQKPVYTLNCSKYNIIMKHDERSTKTQAAAAQLEQELAC